MAVTESLEETSSNSLSSGTASGEPPGGRSLLDLETPCSVPRRPPISRTEAGTLWMQCFQHDFTSLWMCHWHFTHGLLFESPIFFCSRLKKKKSLSKSSRTIKTGCLCPGRLLSPSGPRVLTSHLIQHCSTQGCPC